MSNFDRLVEETNSGSRMIKDIFDENILCKYLDIVTWRCRNLIKYLNDKCNEEVFDVSTLHDYVVSHGNEVTIGNLTHG